MNIDQPPAYYFNRLIAAKSLIYLIFSTGINKEKYNFSVIVIPVVVGSSPISHPKK
jgi:hypothetical protein